MNSLGKIKEFWKGRVVVEDDPLQDHLNPGHVLGFCMTDEGKVTIRVEFANGDRYNLIPEDLVAL